MDAAHRGRLPVVSVIVPTAYAERGPRLQSALAAIWAQQGLGERFDLEPIIVDDASGGDAKQIAERFPGTRYVGLSTNRGLPGARNAGLAVATGQYVAFIDDDDLWLPYRLDRQVAALQEAPGLEVVYSQHVVLRGDKVTGVFPRGDAPSGWLQELALKEAICHLQTCLVPRAAIDKIGGFDESLPVMEDHDFLARLAFCFPFRYLDGVVAVYLASMAPRSPDQFRETLLKRRDSILAILREQADGEQFRSLVVATTALNVARFSYRQGDVRQARVELLQSLEEVPAFTRDAWARARLEEMIVWLALEADSPLAEIDSLCAELKRNSDRRGLRARWRLRLFFAEIWSAAAMGFASDGRHGRTMVRLAVMRTIRLNPLKPLFQPALALQALRSLAPS